MPIMKPKNDSKNNRLLLWHTIVSGASCYSYPSPAKQFLLSLMCHAHTIKYRAARLLGMDISARSRNPSYLTNSRNKSLHNITTQFLKSVQLTTASTRGANLFELAVPKTRAKTWLYSIRTTLQPSNYPHGMLCRPDCVNAASGASVASRMKCRVHRARNSTVRRGEHED
jgi:hypothetical protein